MITFEEVLPLLESESDEDNRLAVILIAQYDLMESMDYIPLPKFHDRIYYDRIHYIRNHEFKEQIIISHNQGYLLYKQTIRRLTRESYITSKTHRSNFITYSDELIPEQDYDNNK